MKTRMADNSLDAYWDNRDKLGKRQQEVFDCIKSNPKITASGICNSLALTINVVAGRVNELMHLQLIKVSGKAKPRNVNQYALRQPNDPLNEFEQSWEEKYKELVEKYNRLALVAKRYRFDVEQQSLFK